MERLWNFMLLKEKRVQRQQMLQALVEFQCKAVNTQHTGSSTQLPAGLPEESWGKNEKSECAPEGQAHQCQSYGRRRFPTYYMQRPYEPRPQYSNTPVQGEVMEGADNQDAGEQGRPVRQNMYRSYRQWFCKGCPHQRQPTRMTMKKIRKMKETGPKVSSHLNICTSHNFNYQCRGPENPKPQDGKETKAQGD
ncbi:hypothetical protein QTO34_000686 [Cnephaeus nilssonii]|uniref:Uncharacterized protein n=1 Tax=Cnephaeus nilssonii TaxID=3371016 RepID=A0AA40ICH0_CNENI|nr:hypothetical protein QTO34_000686 [Eptesicus nilssonii]